MFIGVTSTLPSPPVYRGNINTSIITFIGVTSILPSPPFIGVTPILPSPPV